MNPLPKLLNTALVIGAFALGGNLLAVNSAPQTIYGFVCADGSAPQPVAIGEVSFPTPTAIVQPSATPTATRTPAPSVTPTKATGTPAPSATYAGTCALVANGAERAEPKGQLWYQFSDPQGTGVIYQNIRQHPVNGDVVGRLNKGDERIVHWRIWADYRVWFAIDEECQQWVASWLGNVSIHP